MTTKYNVVKAFFCVVFNLLCDECPDVYNAILFFGELIPGPCPISVESGIGINTINPATALHIKEGHLFIDQKQGLILKNEVGDCVQIVITGTSITTVVVDCPEK